MGEVGQAGKDFKPYHASVNNETKSTRKNSNASVQPDWRGKVNAGYYHDTTNSKGRNRNMNFKSEATNVYTLFFFLVWPTNIVTYSSEKFAV